MKVPFFRIRKESRAYCVERYDGVRVTSWCSSKHTANRMLRDMEEMRERNGAPREIEVEE